jgi:hypothetical protein
MSAGPAARPTDPPPLDARDAWLLMLIAGLYLGLVGATLDWHGYWSDEFHTIHAVELPVPELIRRRASSGHPPLFFLLEKAWVAALGTSEAGTRSLPLLCGLGTLLLTYWIVRREAGRPAAAVACGLLGCGATQLMICQLARSYTLLQLLLTAQTALLLSRQPASAWRLVLSAALTAGALFTHGAALVAVPAQMAAAGVALPRQWRYLLSAAAGSLLYGAFLLTHPALDNVEVHLDWVPPPTITALLRFPALLQFGRYVDVVPPALQALVVLCFVLLGIAALLHSDQAACLALQWFFVWSLAAAAGGWGIGIIGVERYFAPAVACQAAFSAIAISELASRVRWIAWPCAGLAAVLSLGSAGLYAALPPFTPWREMAALVEARRSAGEAVIVVSPEVLATPFAYYYRGEAVFVGESGIATGEMGRGQWVCFCDRSPEATATISAQAEESQLGPPEVHRFHRGAVWHYRPSDG